MTDPLIGRTVYNRHLDNIRAQVAVTLEALNEIYGQEDLGERTIFTLLNNITQAQISIADSVTVLERFGASIKETGELNAEVLKKERD